MNHLFGPLLAGCIVALLAALAVVLARRPVYAALALLAHSLSLAALFAILAADMVAVGQVIIYAGAIVVLFLFVVTLLPTGGHEPGPSGNRILMGVTAGGALLVALAAALAAPLPTPIAEPVRNGVADVGRVLFGPLLVPFELTVPLLLVAIVGAVAVWRRHEPRTPVVPTPERPAGRRLEMHR